MPQPLLFRFVLSIKLQIWIFAGYFLGNKSDPLVKKAGGDSREQAVSSGELEMPTPSGEDRTVQAIIQQVEQGCRPASLYSSDLFLSSYLLIGPTYSPCKAGVGEGENDGDDEDEDEEAIQPSGWRNPWQLCVPAL